MATKELTKLERDVAIIEQTLRAMIEINPSVTQILIDSPAVTESHLTR